MRGTDGHWGHQWVSVWESRGSFANIYSFNEVFSETFSSSGLEWSHFWAGHRHWLHYSLIISDTLCQIVKLEQRNYLYWLKFFEHACDALCKSVYWKFCSHLGGKNMKIKDPNIDCIPLEIPIWSRHIYADGCCSMSSSFEPSGKKCLSCNLLRII